MTASANADVERLSVGLEALLSSGAATQKQIATAVKVDQGFVSRARHGQIKRLTPRAHRLLQYVNMQIGGKNLPEAVDEAVKVFMASGGDPVVLVQTIKLLVAVRAS